ncbi:tetratricopeptide repeat protein [Streptomyces sp. NPDC013455]|uniref:tetratricopeptide repeat protein n=1 Tax=Streptomyces sp. NPDC013455 TaxID=3155605 RepID=UPI0034078FDF
MTEQTDAAGGGPQAGAAGGGPQAEGSRAMAIGGNVGVAVTGDAARVVTLPAEAVRWAREADAPPGAGNLPGSASGVFVGRDRNLDQVHALLTTAARRDAGGGVVVTQAGAVHGLGGVGKSTLAMHYAHRFRAEYGLVWWITADTPEAIVSGLATLALRLCPQWAGTAGTDEQAAWAVTWLGWHSGWLLIFDNVEDPAHLHPYLGALTGGHVLATSRRATGWHKIGPAMPLGLLEPRAAADLLCRLAFDGREPTAEEYGQAEALARDLGWLPLALEQAGAYAYETGTDLGTYRRSLGLMLDVTATGTDPERTIARVWDHTLTAVEDRDPLAVELLYAMAWLAPDDIPRSLLAPLAPDPITLDRALGVLHAYTMVAFTGARGIGVHRLVQSVLRTRHGTGRDRAPRGRPEAEQAVRHAFTREPNVEDGASDLWKWLLPHVLALVESAPDGHVTSSGLSEVYEAAAGHLADQGRRVQTIGLCEAVLARQVRDLGDTHPATLTARHNLAVARREAGDLDGAVALFESILAESVRVLGDTHPQTLVTRNQLARSYRVAGDLQRAITLYETTLAQQVRVRGDTHPDTLVTRHNLAYACREAGHLERAVALFEATLGQRVRVLGDAHPSTLVTRNQLALTYQDSGDVERAIALFEATLAQQVRVLGDSHPDTLITRHNLAYTHQDAGDVERAISLYRTTLAESVRVLGDTHPHTLVTRHNLAFAHQEAGELDLALSLFEATLAQQLATLGSTHPDTRATRHSLARARRQATEP